MPPNFGNPILSQEINVGAVGTIRTGFEVDHFPCYFVHFRLFSQFCCLSKAAKKKVAAICYLFELADFCNIGNLK